MQSLYNGNLMHVFVFSASSSKPIYSRGGLFHRVAKSITGRAWPSSVYTMARMFRTVATRLQSTSQNVRPAILYCSIGTAIPNPNSNAGIINSILAMYCKLTCAVTASPSSSSSLRLRPSLVACASTLVVQGINTSLAPCGLRVRSILHRLFCPIGRQSSTPPSFRPLATVLFAWYTWWSPGYVRVLFSLATVHFNKTGRCPRTTQHIY